MQAAFAASGPSFFAVAPAAAGSSAGVAAPVSVDRSVLGAFGGRSFGRMVPGMLRQRLQPATLMPGQIAVGSTFACAIKTGKMYCWGNNASGQLGVGDTNTRLSPVLVLGGYTDWVQVSAGIHHVCARRATGQLYCWGQGSAGQLGNNATTNSNTPLEVSGLYADWSEVSAGQSHTCGRRGSNAYCWGRGTEGQLGNTGTSQRTTPMAVAGGGGWTSIIASAAAEYSCGVRSGQLYCWGYILRKNEYDYGTGEVSPAVLAPDKQFETNNSNVQEVALGWDYLCWRNSSEDVYCWGDNATQTAGSNITATINGNTSDWVAITAKYNSTCAIRANRTLYCWGQPHHGQLGNGSVSSAASSPTQVDSHTDWVAIASGHGFSTCGMRRGGSVYCWGLNNTAGAVGVGTTTYEYTTPQLVSLP